MCATVRDDLSGTNSGLRSDECIDLIQELLEINITDLETMAYLTSNGAVAPKSIGDEPRHEIPLAMIRSVRSLNLTLFQPPEFYIALVHWRHAPISWNVMVVDMDDFELGSLSQSILQDRSLQAPLWQKIWPCLAALPHLVHVNLWMDHDQPQTWSCIDERKVLQPLCDADWASRVNLAVHLPNLRRDKVVHARHFVDDDTTEKEGLPFKIQRRYRCPTRPERGWWGCSYEPDISEEELIALGNEYGADMTADRWTTITILISQLENRCYRAVDITSRIPEKVKKTFRKTPTRLGYRIGYSNWARNT